MTDRSSDSDGATDGETAVLPDDVPVSVGLVRAVAAVDGRSPGELPALHESVDATSLEALLDDDSDTDAGVKTITFAYAGYDVTVRSDGHVTIQAQDDAA
jgi:hypothetical protein